MSDRAKRLLIIIAFVAIILLLGVAIWLVFLRPLALPTPAVPPTPATRPSAGGLAPAAPAPSRIVPTTPPAAGTVPSPVAAGGLTKTTTLSSSPVLAPFIAPDGVSVQYYNRTDGKFYRILSDGTARALSDKVFYNVSRVSWAPDRQRAILEYPDGSNILYNFVTGSQSTLPKHWQSFSFSPRSDGIAFLAMGTQTDDRWLATAASDGANSKPIEPLGNNASKVQVSWSPNDQVIAFSKTGSPQGFGEQDILLVGKNHENFRALTVSGIGFDGRWSPDGQHILYSVSSPADQWVPKVWVTDGLPEQIGGHKTPLDLATWVNKCAFSGATTVYCAVPRELPAGVGLYPTAIANTPDRLWKVNLQSGARQLVAIPPDDHTIDNLIISPDESFLYFTDQISGQLYKINLK